VILYYCFLIAILVIVALLYELCKVSTIHYAVTINANPSHRGRNYYADIVYITFFYSSETMTIKAVVEDCSETLNPKNKI
jgi:hypothetical protein